MPERPDDPSSHGPPHRDPAERERLVGIVFQELQKESLEEFWDKLRGATPPRHQDPTLSENSFNAWRGLLRWSVPLAAAALVVLCFRLFVDDSQQSGVVLRASADQRGPGTTALPQKARFVHESARLELFEDGARLVGDGIAMRDPFPPGINAFTNNLHGFDAAGVEVWLRSVVWVTNKLGVTDGQGKPVVSGIFVTGSMEIGGRTAESVSQTYVP